MPARTGTWALTGAVLLGAAALFAGTRPGVAPTSDRRPSAPPAALRAAPDVLGEPGVAAASEPAVSETTRASSPYETALVKSTPALRHWHVDPREIQAVEGLGDGAFQDLVFSAHFGGGLRVERPGKVRLGIARDLEAGDVVREINGIHIRDESQFRLLAGRLWRKSGVIRATVDRAGASIVITYQRAGAPLPPSTFR